jgi:hypothetical protein
MAWVVAAVVVMAVEESEVAIDVAAVVVAGRRWRRG